MSPTNEAVKHYIKNRRDKAERELRWFAIQRTLVEAVSVAALARSPCGKRLHHQRRIPQSALQQSRRRLLDCLPAIERCRSFESLHELVSQQIRSIPGIGELVAYDTALRIGVKLHLEPKVVFLHAGTRVGAKRLGIDVRRKYVDVRELPQPLRRLTAREIEDVLCIYKDWFGHAPQRRGNQTRDCYSTGLNQHNLLHVRRSRHCSRLP
jgi:hypothetical protein